MLVWDQQEVSKWYEYIFIVVIPEVLTSQIQPLDFSINNTFKNFMRDEWNKWIESQIIMLL